jgi:hypothetical protein
VAAAVGSEWPWVAELVLSPALIPDTADVAPLVGRPVDLSSLVVPNSDGWFACAAVVLVVNALLKEFTVGCIVGVDELFDAPKLKVDFGGSDEVVVAAELDGGAVATLFVIPKLNFGFDASPVPPAGGALALGLELVLVEVEESGARENENRRWGAGPLPWEVDEIFGIGLFASGFAWVKLKIEGVDEPFAAANEGPVVGGACCVKRLGMVELDGTGPLAAGVETEVCVAGTGAGENDNEVPENGWAVLVSGLPRASPN